MIDRQKMEARIQDLVEAKVPVTNYGLLLAYAHDSHALDRCLKPWGLSAPVLEKHAQVRAASSNATSE
jgi:hypothetical protein